MIEKIVIAFRKILIDSSSISHNKQLLKDILDKEAITCSLSSNASITTTRNYEAVQIKLDRINYTVGENLTLQNGAIKIGKNIKRVLVNGNIGSSGSTTMFGLTIYKNDTAVFNAFIVPASGSSCSLSASPFVIDVEEGDTISMSLYINNTGSKTVLAYDGTSTYLTVQSLN